MKVLTLLHGQHGLMAGLLYGAGLGLMECVRLRIQDIDFGYHQIVVRDRKGQKERFTILPKQTYEDLRKQISGVRVLNNGYLADGFGVVYLPNALERKYPNANREFNWQYLFPSKNLLIDPRTGTKCRHRACGDYFQTVLKNPVRDVCANKKGRR